MNLWNPSEAGALFSADFCFPLTLSLLHFLWQGAAIGLAVWAGDRLLRRAPSQWRYIASALGLLAMFLCVPTTYVAIGYFPFQVAVDPTIAASAPASGAPVTVGAPSGHDAHIAALAAGERDTRSRNNGDLIIPAAAATTHVSGWTWQSLLRVSPSIAPYATLAYLLGVAIMLGRLGLAVRSGNQLRQSATLLSDANILAMTARQARRIGLKVVPAIAWCQQAAVPLVVGIVRPMILLPTAIASGLAPDQLEALLAHELAHLKRLDLVVNLVQRLAESLLFFHPAVWYVSRKISIERENCCDDCVLWVGFGRVEYADALVRMAEVCAAARGLVGLEGAALLAASGETPSQFKRRVLRLLDGHDHLRIGISRRAVWSAIGLALVAALILSSASVWTSGDDQKDRRPQPAAKRQQSAEELRDITAAPVEAGADRPKEKLYLRGQDALDRIDKVKPAWSDAQCGIEFGVALIGDKKQFRSGERVPLEMFVRNVGDKTVKVQLGAEFLGNVPEVKNERGEAVPIEKILLLGAVALYRETLKPGEAFGFRHLGLGLGPKPNKEFWHPYWAEPKPGKYTLRHTHHIDVAPADEGKPGQPLNFTSGVVEFEVVDSAESDRRPSPDEAKRTFQAARLDRQHYLEGTYPNDERLIKAEVFAAEQALRQSQASVERAKRLAAKGLITPIQLQAADAAEKQAEGQLELAQGKLDVLQKFTKEKTLRELDRKVVDALEALLDLRVALKVTDRPLIFVLDELEKAHQVPVTVDLKEIHARGLSEHARVTVDVTDTPLREVFKVVLASGGLNFEVTENGIAVPAKAKPKAADGAEKSAGSTRIVVKYDIPGAEEEGQIFVQHVGGKDIVGTSGNSHLRTNPVKKGGTLELADLEPGDYQVARHRMIQLGGFGTSRFLDRRQFQLKAGETKTIEFARRSGRPATGKVLGLKEAGLDTAVVNVCSENAKDEKSLGDLKVTVFDARLCAADGTFTTEQLAPGTYLIIAEGYVSLTPEQRTQSGIITPRFVGTARLTVPAQGELAPIEVRLDDTQKRADAKETAAARLVINYDLPGAEEKGRFVVEGPQGYVGPETIGLVKVNPLKNGQKLEIGDLAPGAYQVTRYRTLMLEDAFGVSRFLDGRQFQLKDGEMKALDFTRKSGRPVAGKILGLEGKGINKVLVNVCDANVEIRQSLSRAETIIFDALLCNDDGTFKTEPLAPGRYTIVADAYLPLTPLERVSTGSIEPRYVGMAKFVVPESGKTPEVEVKLEEIKKDAGKDATGAVGPAQAWGDLDVQFIYDGPRPEPEKFKNVRDLAVFGKEIPDQSLLVGDKGGLANVAVFVTSADVPIHPEERKRAERPIELKVAGSNFVPRILPVMLPQNLKLTNDTPVAVNFHCVGRSNAGFNMIVPAKESLEAKLEKAERAPAIVANNIHAWMQAFVLPLDHPYAAATGANGIARLNNLPEGEWTFRFWHEKGGFLKSAETGERDFNIKIRTGANRLSLRVSPKFTVKAELAAGDKQPDEAPPKKADESRRAAPEPDASVRKVIEQPGVAIIPDQAGRIVDVAVGTPANDDLLKQLALLPELKKLHIETTHQLTAKGFDDLAAAPALESLSLYDIQLPPGSLASLARMANLKELSINECGLRDADLAAFAGLTKLRSLSLRGNAITDAGLASIVKLTELEELDLGNSSSVGSQMQISDDGLFCLTSLKRLKRLNLSSTRLPLGFSDKGLAVLPGFRDLETVDLSGFGLTDEALVHIGRCAQLRSLGLHFGGFTDKGMAEIRYLKRLQRVSISSGQLTEAGLLHLGALPALEFAELRTDGVTDRVLETLSGIKSLARLDLYANSRPGVSQSLPPFTAAGLAHFKDHPGLRTLWLTNMNIGASMLDSLKGLTQLGELTLMMPSLSDEEVRALQIALPKTRVSAAWGGHGIAPLQLNENLKRRGLPPIDQGSD